MKQIELKAIKEDTTDAERVQKLIVKLLRDEIYLPLLKELVDKPRIKNSIDDLVEAIRSGKISHSRGQFKGRFAAGSSRELKRLGAKWDRKQGAWKIPLSSLPHRIRQAIRLSQSKFEEKIQKLDRTLSSLLPDQIADKINLNDIIDKTIFKLDGQIKKSLAGIVVEPEFTKQQLEKIRAQYTENMRLSIRQWSEKEIKKLRRNVIDHTLKGNRYEQLIEGIQQSYGVGVAKARFLARQETNLLTAKIKEVRYQSAGVKQYRWYCVAGSANHPVRPMHKALEGKVFSWDDPPVVNASGERKNPGEDFNCRCQARPIVKF